MTKPTIAAAALIQTATLAARSRTGDGAIGTRVLGGQAQVVRVIRHAKGVGCDVLPVSEFMSLSAVVAHLNGMGRA